MTWTTEVTLSEAQRWWFSGNDASEKSEDDPRVKLLVEMTRKIRTKKKPWAIGIRRPTVS